jgi:hypothetical protein
VSAREAAPGWLPWLLLLLVIVPAGLGWLALAGPLLKARRMQRVDAESGTPRKSGDLAGGPAGMGSRAEGLPCPGDGAVEAVRRLEEARLLLYAAESLLNDASSGSIWDILGLSMDRGQAKQSSFGAGVRKLREAEDLAYRAFGQLRQGEGREPLELDTDPVLLGMATAWVTHGPSTSLGVQRRVAQARRRARDLLARVEVSLAQQRRVG